MASVTVTDQNIGQYLDVIEQAIRKFVKTHGLEPVARIQTDLSGRTVTCRTNRETTRIVAQLDCSPDKLQCTELEWGGIIRESATFTFSSLISLRTRLDFFPASVAIGDTLQLAEDLYNATAIPVFITNEWVSYGQAVKRLVRRHQTYGNVRMVHQSRWQQLGDGTLTTYTNSVGVGFPSPR